MWLHDDELKIEAGEIRGDRLPKELGARASLPQIGTPKVQMRARVFSPLDLVDAGVADQFAIDDPRQKESITTRVAFGQVMITPGMIEPFGA